MKKLIFLCFFLPVFSQAQKLIGGKNILKVSATSLLFRNYNFMYERHIFSKLSFAISYSNLPSGKLPFVSSYKDQIDISGVNLDNVTIGGSSITPEIRLYTGLGKMKGFYVAPYLRFSNYNLTIPVSYTYTPPLPAPPNPVTATATFQGSLKSTNYGLMLGLQKQIATKIVLDFWILGGHFGNVNGSLTTNNISPALIPEARTALQARLDGLKDVPFLEMQGTINSPTSATVSVGKWAGIRSLGLSLGLRF